MIKELTGKHVLIIFLVFFGVIFAVNGFMIYKSQSTWNGLETEDAYRKGLKYNQQLSELHEQNERGWIMDVKREELPGDIMRFTAMPKDHNQQTLTLLDLSLELKRPTHEGMDRVFPLKETALGVYTGETQALPKGKWYLLVTARRKDEILYRSRNELYLR
jgi:nitrogen fixation protein FixH